MCQLLYLFLFLFLSLSVFCIRFSLCFPFSPCVPDDLFFGQKPLNRNRFLLLSFLLLALLYLPLTCIFLVFWSAALRRVLSYFDKYYSPFLQVLSQRSPSVRWRRVTAVPQTMTPAKPGDTCVRHVLLRLWTLVRGKFWQRSPCRGAPHYRALWCDDSKVDVMSMLMCVFVVVEVLFSMEPSKLVCPAYV